MNAPERDVDERFADWIDGCMSPRDRERFEAELRVNAALRARLDDYRNTVETVRRALDAPLPRIDVADAVMERIASGAAGPAAVQRQPWRHASRRALWLSGSLAAAAALLIGVLLNWEPTPSTSDVASKPAAPMAPATDPDASNSDRAKTQLSDHDAVEELDRSVRRLDNEVQHIQLKSAEEGARDQGESGAAASTARGLAGGEKAGFEQKRQETQDSSTLVGGVSNQPERRAANVAQPGAAPPPPDAPTAAARADGPPAEKTPIATALTMLPQVMLQRRDGDAYAVPQGQTASATSATAFFMQSRSEIDLASALPAATLQIRRLEALPPASTLEPLRESLKSRLRADTDRSQDIRKAQHEPQPEQPGQAQAQTPAPAQNAGEVEAWLIEGAGPEVYSYLARLSDVGRGCGYEVAFGEVPTREVELLLPAMPDTGAVAAGGNEHYARDQLQAKDDERSAGRTQPVTRGNAPGGTDKSGTDKSGANKKGDSKGGDKSGELAKNLDAEIEKAKAESAAKEHRLAEQLADGKPRGAPAGERASAPGTPEPIPVPDPMPAQARVVVIIERAKAR